MLVIGHRGALGYEPENTLSSFRLAIDMGVDMVECDVFTLSSGECVILHDEKVDRTTDGTGYVTDYALDNLKKLKTINNESIPRLEDLLDLVDKRCGVLIELKGLNTALPVAEIINHYIIKKGWDKKMFTVQSFNHTELKKFEKIAPHISTATLMAAMPLDYAEYTDGLNVIAANIPMPHVTQAYIDDIHTRGLQTYVWAVNEIDDLKRFVEIGIDGVISDYPDIMIKALAELPESH